MIYTPDSILNRKNQWAEQRIGKRDRYSTCSGVTWFHENYLAAVNLYGQKITIYEFNEQTKEFTLLQEITNKDRAHLTWPEQITVSPDGKFLAVPGGGSHINIYAVNLENHLITPKPILVMPAPTLTHSVRFTLNGNYMAYASFHPKQAICVYKVSKNQNSIQLTKVFNKTNTHKNLYPKAINFTQDNKYIVLAWAPTPPPPGKKHIGPVESILESYKFNPDGTIGEIISSVKRNHTVIEDITFLENDTAMVMTNQAEDSLLIYSFDPITGKIDNNPSSLKNPEAQLSFPHGIGISQNGKYLAVTSYGDDTVNIYQVD